MENKNFLKRFISVGLTSAMVFSVCTPNCFAMRGRGYDTLRMVQSMGPRQCSIGPPKQPTKHLTEKVDKSQICSVSKSWLQLGVTATTAMCGSSLAKKMIPAVLGQKGKALVVSSVVRAYSSIPRIEKAAHAAVAALNISTQIDDLNKHGVKFTFYVIHRRIVECRCSIGKNHDMAHVEPIVKIEYSTY